MDENNTSLVDVSLAESWTDPEKLPDINEWLQEPRTEAVQAQYAFVVLKKHFARADLEIKNNNFPVTLYGFNWTLYLNIEMFICKREHSAMLRELLAELVEFVDAIAGEYFAYHLLEMLEKFIDRDPTRALILPLLPPKALEQMDEMKEMMARNHEEYMRRLDQMSY